MRIQPGNQILGIPVLTMRKLLKYVQGLQSGTLDVIAEQLDVWMPQPRSRSSGACWKRATSSPRAPPSGRSTGISR